VRIEVDGAPATAEQLAVPALLNYGHFTMMQVRGGAVRGLDLHLRRLDGATRELFEVGLEGRLVRDRVRHALGGPADATVRVNVFQQEAAAQPSIMVVVRPPAEMPPHPQRLQVVEYLRPVAHIKHVGSFGQIFYGRRAEREGFDDALLVGAGGEIAETAIANLAFFDETGVVWPEAPLLEGITMQLVEPRLASRRAVVRLDDLASFRGAFLTNSLGVGAVGEIGATRMPLAGAPLDAVRQAYASVPWDPI
jgi:branched-subunit amino acid aminotransferase/4-amino-4-deoxychorismate lyase